MLLALEKKAAGSIEADALFGSGERVLLAVSGGADSTALMYAMHALKTARYFDADLLCAHINHRLRGPEADLDEQFVVEQAGKLGLPVMTRRLDVRGFARRNGLSIETAARNLRIEALLDIARDAGCRRIATAHQKDDNAETLVGRLIRGTGYRGLAGIWPAREFAGGYSFVRPLLCATRHEILQYLAERGLKYRRDHTNADCTYRRNYIRHRLLPAIQRECRGSLAEQLSQLAERARRFHDLVGRHADNAWPRLARQGSDAVSLDLHGLLLEPKPVRIELFRRGLAAIGSGEKDLTHWHYDGMMRLADGDARRGKIDLPGAFIARRESASLVFARPRKDAHPDRRPPRPVTLNVPGRTGFGRYLIETTLLETETADFERFRARKDNCVEWFDLNALELPLMVRSRLPGDRFRPLGLPGEKKVGKFLTAARVPEAVRRRMLVVADAMKIIWAWPVRMSEHAKVTAATTRILQVRIEDANEGPD